MSPVTRNVQVHLSTAKHGRHRLRQGPKPPPFPGHTPRIAKLMALAIHFDALIVEGKIADYATIARVGGVSRARITQIVNLTLLAPDIQEHLLFLPKQHGALDPFTIRELQPIAREPNWQRQRQLWNALKARKAPKDAQEEQP